MKQMTGKVGESLVEAAKEERAVIIITNFSLCIINISSARREDEADDG